MDPEVIGQIAHFFVSDNLVQGRKFDPTRRVGAAAALRLLERAEAGFREE